MLAFEVVFFVAACALFLRSRVAVKGRAYFLAGILLIFASLSLVVSLSVGYEHTGLPFLLTFLSCVSRFAAIGNDKTPISTNLDSSYVPPNPRSVIRSRLCLAILAKFRARDSKGRWLKQ